MDLINVRILRNFIYDGREIKQGTYKALKSNKNGCIYIIFDLDSGYSNPMEYESLRNVLHLLVNKEVWRTYDDFLKKTKLIKIIPLKKITLGDIS